MTTTAIKKTLSANDTGETGAHQAGILVPKILEIISFFPRLGTDTKNPRVKLSFYDESRQVWSFNFIYYNNVFFGGTRNEYRLTGMTNFIRQNNLRAGDTIMLEKYSGGTQIITYTRANIKGTSDDVLRLGSTWKVIRL